MAPFRHKVARTVVVLLLVLAVAAIWIMVRRILLGKAAPEVDVLLPLLPIAVVVLALGLAGILIRNLVRLIMDRQRGVLGSRLRTKLVFFFLFLVLPPAAVLFYGAGAVISETVDGMLETPVEDITLYSKEIVDDWTDFLKARCLDQADRIAKEIRRNDSLHGDRAGSLERLLKNWMDEEELNLIVVTSGEKTVARLIDATVEFDASETDEPATIREDIAEVLDRGLAITRLDYLGTGLMAHALTPIYGRPGTAAAGPEGVVAVGIFLPHALAGRLEQISRANEEFRQFEARRDELIGTYLLLLTLIFLASVFLATWMGFYLSKRISEPIRELADASREIAAGNLGVRVKSTVGDEAGTLVEAFNDMAAQLQESQEVITRSTGELRRSNRALDERRRYIETLLSNLSTGVMSLDGQGRVTTANPAAEGILGCRIRTGDRARVVLDVAGLEPLTDLLDEVEGRTGGEVRRDLTVVRDGETLSIAVQASALPVTAGKAGTLIMIEDLTDLLRAQKAAAWREVARRIAHEIKNPLTPIQLAAQRLRKKFDTDQSDLEHLLPEATDSIQREVSALKGLVDEFSRFARMPEVSPEPVEFNEVVDSALALYRGVPGVTWEVDTDPQVGVIEVDPEQMRRALINLIDNAVAAVSGDGTIRISTRPHSGPGTLHLEVSDTGPGIAPGDRAKMFAPYFSTKGRGTGLGLAIVHRVVTDHRGSIRIEDNDPQGARFVIEIPG